MSARSGLVGNKKIPAPFGAISGQFSHGPEKCKKNKILAIFLGGPMGPIHPVWELLCVHIFTWLATLVGMCWGCMHIFIESEPHGPILIQIPYFLCKTVWFLVGPGSGSSPRPDLVLDQKNAKQKNVVIFLGGPMDACMLAVAVQKQL